MDWKLYRKSKHLLFAQGRPFLFPDRIEKRYLLKDQKLKKYIISILIISLILFKVTYAIAQPEEIRTRSILKFFSGIISAFSIHEASHALVAELTDTEMSWEWGSYNQPIGFTEHASSDSKGVSVYSAGLLSETIGSEFILRHEKIDRNDAFVRGFMMWNVLNPILYALDYWVFRVTNKENNDFYQGDLQGIEHYTNEPTAHGFALSMATIAAFQGYRFLKTQSWAPERIKKKSQHISLEPIHSGGAQIKYKFFF